MELAVSGGYAIGRNILVAADSNSSALATLASVTNNTATYGGTITLGSSLSIASAATGGNGLIFSGLITSPSGALSGVTVTAGSVSFVYAGSESYTGGTTVSGGSLGVGAAPGCRARRSRSPGRAWSRCRTRARSRWPRWAVRPVPH